MRDTDLIDENSDRHNGSQETWLLEAQQRDYDCLQEIERNKE